MTQIVRTILAGHLGTCKMLNRQFTLLPNSTLNQRFNIHKDEVPAVNEYPAIAYVAIGNKGSSYEIAGDGQVLTDPIPHTARHCGLYNFIPFVLREINNDISATERAKYRLRVPVNIDNVMYVAYYLRVLPMTDVIPAVEIRNVSDGTISTKAFTPTLSDLTPTPPVISNTDLNDPNGDYLVSSAKVDFVLDQNDVMNIRDACNILYGDPRYAVISELALCSGVDKVLQGQFGAGISNYTDSIATQVSAFISQYHSLTATTTEVRINFDLGSVEPLLT